MRTTINSRTMAFAVWSVVVPVQLVAQPVLERGDGAVVLGSCPALVADKLDSAPGERPFAVGGFGPVGVFFDEPSEAEGDELAIALTISPLERLAALLADASAALDADDSSYRVEIGEPVPSWRSDGRIDASGVVRIHVEGGDVVAGSYVVTVDLSSGVVDLVVRIPRDGGQEVLEAHVMAESGVLTMSMVERSGPVDLSAVDDERDFVRRSVWTYPPSADAAAPVLGVWLAEETAAPSPLRASPRAPLFIPRPPHWPGFVINIISSGIAGIIDIFRPYTPPTACNGPLINDGAGQSCEDVDVPCADILDDMCLLIDSLPNVSTAFKKCMKGRCGCGGSSHARARMTCAESDACGPCEGVEADGCNSGGPQLWYCGDDLSECECVSVVFHEMSHSCGALDLENGANNDAYRIGDWFQGECEGLDTPPVGQ